MIKVNCLVPGCGELDKPGALLIGVPDGRETTKDHVCEKHFDIVLGMFLQKNPLPAQADFQKFVEVFDTLNGFEVNQRAIRGYGAFDEKELPMPEVVRVVAWLREFCGA